jgi:hypothetical protein
VSPPLQKVIPFPDIVMLALESCPRNRAVALAWNMVRRSQGFQGMVSVLPQGQTLVKIPLPQGPSGKAGYKIYPECQKDPAPLAEQGQPWGSASLSRTMSTETNISPCWILSNRTELDKHMTGCPHLGFQDKVKVWLKEHLKATLHLPCLSTTPMST